MMNLHEAVDQESTCSQDIGIGMHFFSLFLNICNQEDTAIYVYTILMIAKLVLITGKSDMHC